METQSKERTMIKIKHEGRHLNFYIGRRRLLSIKITTNFDRTYAKRFQPLSEAEQRLILEHQFQRALGYHLNLEAPQSFNEKIQWLKLYYHHPLMTICSDKVQVRKYIADTIGEQYLVPCLGIYQSPEEIDFASLPSRFALKTNWGSGQNIICTNKQELDIPSVRQQLSQWLKPEFNHYFNFLEWCYKDISPLIIAEQFIESTDDLRDFKFYCFNGKAEYLLVCGDRNTSKYFDFYDMNLNFLPFTNGARNSGKPLQKPHNFALMRQFAEKLSAPFPHARVDFFEDRNQNLFVGEITFYSGNGLDPFDPIEWDYKLGQSLTLPEKML